MFSGIVSTTGLVSEIIDTGGDKSFIIDTGNLEREDLVPGESICVNGVCLTAVNVSDRGIRVDVSTETLSCTTFGDYVCGSRVNLERALRPVDRLNGHIVSGHVDTVGTVVRMNKDAGSILCVVDVPGDYLRYLSKKGSVCIDGVSLTVNDVIDNTIFLNIIPFTSSHTIIREYTQGTRVNVEVDIIARYLESLMQCQRQP